MDFPSWFQSLCPDIPLRGAAAVLKLSMEGATVPFIARYRKEQTGNLDEVAIERVIKSKNLWDEIEKRKEFILGEIEAQKKLTPELKKKIEETYELSVLEDLYLPYKKKRKTRATVAKEAGLEPLAELLWQAAHGAAVLTEGETLEQRAATYLNAEAGFADSKAALEGAQHILVERLSELPDLRQAVRTALFERGHVHSAKAGKAKPNSKFERYFEYNEHIPSLLKPENTHRYLAIRRGQSEEELTVTISGPPAEPEFLNGLLQKYELEACSDRTSPAAPVLLAAARQAFKYYVLTAIEAEVHAALKQTADEAAIQVFAENVRKLLLAAPFGAKCVLGVDPGIRTGCKLALVDKSGKFIGSAVIHTENPNDQQQSRALLKALAEKAELQAIAVGNGTAARETEAFLKDAVDKLKLKIPVVMVSEAGASIYSASEVAREEFPDLDLTIRGAISIARRLQDPLAELVKVDPKSIGVGQYQHDVNQHGLKQSLERVVESCVNNVGVNVNTASEHLLAYVSGIGPALAKAIVQHRGTHGLFAARADLLKVPRFSNKTFEQAAGFLRIPGAGNPLDNTGVHPERYAAIEGYARRLNKGIDALLGQGAALLKADSTLRQELGDFTFEDIVRELEKPGRDPRDQFVPFEFRHDIHQVEDLQPGMSCPGIVTNVTNFGAFVDIGVHQDGLVHVSQMSDQFVKDPRTVVNPGDRVTVRVLEVNLEKRQIALSMRGSAAPAARPQKESKKPAGKQGGQKPPREEPFKNTPFAGLGDLLGKR